MYFKSPCLSHFVKTQSIQITSHVSQNIKKMITHWDQTFLFFASYFRWRKPERSQVDRCRQRCFSPSCYTSAVTLTCQEQTRPSKPCHPSVCAAIKYEFPTLCPSLNPHITGTLANPLQWHHLAFSPCTRGWNCSHTSLTILPGRSGCSTDRRQGVAARPLLFHLPPYYARNAHGNNVC